MILRMKRIMLAAFAALFATAAGAAERRYTVTDFDRVEVSGPFQVTLKTGRAGSAVASGSNQAIDRVSIDVQGRTLRVRPNRSAWGGYPGEGAGPLKIELSSHGLRAASVNGAGSIGIDKARAMKFDISVSGSGQIVVGEVEADNLSLGCSARARSRSAGKRSRFGQWFREPATWTPRNSSRTMSRSIPTLRAPSPFPQGAAPRCNSTGRRRHPSLRSPACTVKALGSGRVACGR
jgi:hypothetical protein